MQEAIQAFAQRWRGLDLSTFAHILQHAQGEDQVIAAFAVGYTHSAWAKALLLPFLHSDNTQLRWAVALCLGEMREPEALPMLVQMLQEFLPPPPSTHAEYDWFEVEHMHVARLLGYYGDTSIIPTLSETLERIWLLEQQHPDANVQWWWYYQEALAYALGQLGTLDAPTNMQLPIYRYRYWTIHSAMGYLNAEESYKNSIVRIMQPMIDYGQYRDLYKLLLQVLQQKVGLSLQEAELFIRSYNDDRGMVWYATDEERLNTSE
jgi:hypothetical protein